MSTYGQGLIAASMVTEHVGDRRLHAHGSYVWEQRDLDGVVWETMVQVTDHTARRLIAEALDQSTPDPYSVEASKGNPDLVVEDWMFPDNKQFVIYQATSGAVWAIYRHDWKTYIVRAEGRRLMRHYCEHRISQSTTSLLRDLFGA